MDVHPLVRVEVPRVRQGGLRASVHGGHRLRPFERQHITLRVLVATVVLDVVLDLHELPRFRLLPTDGLVHERFHVICLLDLLLVLLLLELLLHAGRLFAGGVVGGRHELHGVRGRRHQLRHVCG